MRATDAGVLLVCLLCGCEVPTVPTPLPLTDPDAVISAVSVTHITLNSRRGGDAVRVGDTITLHPSQVVSLWAVATNDAGVRIADVTFEWTVEPGSGVVLLDVLDDGGSAWAEAYGSAPGEARLRATTTNGRTATGHPVAWRGVLRVVPW